jgi:hypothetical protein
MILTKDTENEYDFKNYLIDATPEILWFGVDAQGDYTGQVQAVGVYDNGVLVFKGYYGSCSGCGGWGEGGEPRNLKEVKDYSTLYWELDLSQIEVWESLKPALKEAIEYARKKRDET